MKRNIFMGKIKKCITYKMMYNIMIMIIIEKC